MATNEEIQQAKLKMVQEAIVQVRQMNDEPKKRVKKPATKKGK